jgi:hypothetical protein
MGLPTRQEAVLNFMESKMSLLKIERGTLVILVLAVLVAACPTARADTTTLICRLDSSSLPITESEPTTIELNKEQSSVVVHFSARTINASGARSDAYSIGPLPATFSADTISFSDPHPFWIFSNFKINRLTGTFFAGNGVGDWKWDCEAGKAKF